MKLYKTKESARLARNEGLADAELCEAAERAEKGLIYAQLGKFLIKQRVGGSRAIMFHGKGRTILLHVFAKREKENLSKTELENYRDFAKELAQVTDKQLLTLVEQGRWIEVDYDGYKEKISKQSASVAAPRGRGSSRGRRD